MTNPVEKILALRMRKAWAKNDSLRDADKTIPENIQVFDNISYGPYKKANLLALYSPKDSVNENLPCIVNIHGGGFFYGNKEIYQFYSADLAQRGFKVITFNYRLAPENRYPKQLEDINQLMFWVQKNAEKYHLDLNNLFITGDSAGGNLAYTYSAILTNPQFAKKFSFDLPKNIKPKALGLNCGNYDCELPENTPKSPLMKAYLGRGGFEKNKERLRVKNFITKDFPPCYVVSGSKDFLLYQLQPLVQLLNSKGIKNQWKVYGTKDDENSCHVFHVNVSLDLAKQCNDDECNFFKSFFS